MKKSMALIVRCVDYPFCCMYRSRACLTRLHLRKVQRYLWQLRLRYPQYRSSASGLGFQPVTLKFTFFALQLLLKGIVSRDFEAYFLVPLDSSDIATPS
jgi:hypothetical protein